MKKSALVISLILVLLGQAAFAETTIRTLTPFTDINFAAQAFEDLMESWESETGNKVEDYSGAQDEEWFSEMKRKISAGEADILVIPLYAELDREQLVPIAEMLAVAPECGAHSIPAMEGNGQAVLTPVRFNWESLYVNMDVFEQVGLTAPRTYDEFMVDCAIFSQMGILPVANALCEWSEIVLDCLALVAAPAEQYGSEASRQGVQQILSDLVAVGAFGSDPWNATDNDMMNAFFRGEAAMRFDSADLLTGIPEERWEHTAVLSLPGKDGELRDVIVGSPAYGLAVTRACWNSDRRDAAMQLVSRILSISGIAGLAGTGTNMLGNSVAALTIAARDCTGILYDLYPDTFDEWAESVVSSLMTKQ